jgi:antitoxin VapB
VAKGIFILTNPVYKLYLIIYSIQTGSIVMAISIRNQNAEQLAREVASVTGESITQAIIHALRERLERLSGRRTAPDALSDIMAISKRCSELPEIDPRSSDEILGYNKDGAPEHGD